MARPSTEASSWTRGPLIFVRSAVFNVFFFAASFFMTLPASVVRVISPRHVLGFAMAWARVIVWGLRTICGITVEVTGRENLPSGAALIASSHQSALDTLVWMTLVPRCCYVLKQELIRIPLFGKLITASAMIPIDRSSGPNAIRSLLKGGDRAVREARQIVIFPEGTRAAYGAALPLQPGVAALAARTGLPVIPVATDSGLHWGRRSFQKIPGTIHIVIRPALPAGLPRAELMVKLAHAMRYDIGDGDGPVDKSVG